MPLYERTRTDVKSHGDREAVTKKGRRTEGGGMSRPGAQGTMVPTQSHHSSVTLVLLFFRLGL